MIQKYFKKAKKATSLSIAVLMIASIVAGCSQEPVKDTNGNAKQEEQRNETDTRVIKDMAGREVEVPKKVNKVFTTSPVGTIALYSINPDKIAGLNREADKLEIKYLTKEYTELPVLGTYKDADSGNEEEILAAKPDVIISMGTIDEGWIESANKSQEKLGVPFLMVDGDLEKLDKMYEFLGDLLGEEERAKELANYCKETIDNSKDLASKIPEDKRVKVYYANDESALTTNVTGTIHTQAIDLIGAINAADITVDKISGGVEVSMEQVLNWNPQAIIATKGAKGNKGAYDTIKEDEKWSTIDAVKDGKVYAIPDAPFNWFDRPPSINRVIGVRWLGNLIYPEYFDIDIKQETKDFYELFYHRELTDEEVDEILENAVAK